MVKPSVFKSRALPLLVCLALILTTRAVTLTYNMHTHPDEVVFYSGTESLMEHIMDPSQPFEEFKEYPEGAYVFMLPFFFLGRGLSALLGMEMEPPLWGRVAGASYFVLAYMLGRRILRLRLKAPREAEWSYGLILCFGIFFLEHSRYGTGDMISVFLLMAIIELSCQWISSRAQLSMVLGGLALAAACFLSGALAAVKYPLIQFLLIPLGAYLYGSKAGRGHKALVTVGLVALAAAGLLLCSPKAIGDLGYFVRASTRELGAYVTVGTFYRSGGPLNRIASLVAYTLFYSDFPLLILALAWGLWKGWRRLWQRRGQRPMDPNTFLLRFWIPLMGLIFFLYNLIPKLLVFRSYTSYFFLAALYGSQVLAVLWKRGKVWRLFLGMLCAFMVTRGVFFTWVMSDNQKPLDHMAELIQGAVDKDWRETIFFEGEPLLTADLELVQPQFTDINAFIARQGGDPSMAPGTLVISGSLEHFFAGRYIAPVIAPGPESYWAVNYNYQWAFFKEVNAGHYVGQSYPDWYYYLFGGWLRGSTLSSSVIPCNMIYYYPSPTA